MKAIRVDRYGSPDVLHVQDIAIPAPGRGEVLVKIAAAGLNFVDTYYRTGQYAEATPFTVGGEGAGEVTEIGPGVTQVQVGDRVAFVEQVGTYAEYAVVPADRVIPLPVNISFQHAAAMMLQGLTAHYLSHTTFPLEAWHTALIHAAAGGVGHLLVQMAKMRGARVIGTASTREKAELAREAGADEMILYTQADFVRETERLTQGEGVNVVYDGVGQATFRKGLDCLKPRGYMVLFGQASGAVEPIDPQVLNAKGSLFLTRPTLGHYIADRAELLLRATDLFDWSTDGRLNIRIDKIFELDEAAEAHRYIENRETRGKVLLVP